MKRRIVLGALLLLSCGAASMPPRAELDARPPPPPRPASAPAIDVAITTQGICARIDRNVHCAQMKPKAPLRTNKPLLEDVDAFAISGFGTVCGIRRGKVLCFGSNDSGELGAGLAVVGRAEPIDVPGLPAMTAIVAGNHHLCALAKDHSVWCWGKNEEGQTGSEVSYEGASTRMLVHPSRVPSVAAEKLVAANDATCALTTTHTVSCWGLLSVHDDAGAHAMMGFRPLDIEGLGDVTDVAAGDETFCAATSHGDVTCWGVLEKISPNPNPSEWLAGLETHRIEGLHDVVSLGVVENHGCALVRDGSVWCWGRNFYGELGRGPKAVEGEALRHSYYSASTERPLPLEPAPVANLPSTGAIAVGPDLACALTLGAELFCWGRWPHPYLEADPNGERVPIAPSPVRVDLR